MSKVSLTIRFVLNFINNINQHWSHITTLFSNGTMEPMKLVMIIMPILVGVELATWVPNREIRDFALIYIPKGMKHTILEG